MVRKALFWAARARAIPNGLLPCCAKFSVWAQHTSVAGLAHRSPPRALVPLRRSLLEFCLLCSLLSGAPRQGARGRSGENLLRNKKTFNDRLQYRLTPRTRVGLQRMLVGVREGTRSQKEPPKPTMTEPNAFCSIFILAPPPSSAMGGVDGPEWNRLPRNAALESLRGPRSSVRIFQNAIEICRK